MGYDAHKSNQRSHQPPADTQKKRRHSRFGIGFYLGTFLLIMVLTCTMVFGLFMIYVKTTLSSSLEINADDYTVDQSSILYYQNGDTGDWDVLQTIHGTENRIWVDYDQIPDAMWQAAVAIEDQRFFEHHGVDWKRTIGATLNMFIGKNATYGGSTITQQLLKNMTKDDQNTVKRKVTEIFRALEFEKKYSKQEILEMYLNTIYLGSGCYGVQTAAKYYFGKDVSQLDIAECAAVIGITNNPSIYNPLTSDKTHENNKERQKLILKKMWEQNYITEEQYNQAIAEPLNFTDGSTSASELVAEAEGVTDTSTVQSYFVDQVYRDVVSDLAEELNITEAAAKTKMLHSGYRIYTTVKPEIQDIAEAVYENRSNLNVTSASGQKLQSGITIVDVTNGNVVAMVGGIGEKTQDLNWNYAVGRRQCGSSIKPLTVYAPALDAGVITMASAFDNYPVRLLNGNPWPKNSPSGYTGFVTLSTGVAKSINTVAVRVIEKLGTSASYEFATEKLGLGLVPDDLNESSLGLGGLTNGVTTEEMAAAYASFANDGVYNTPRLYTKVTHMVNGEETVVLDNNPDSQVAMKETTAYFMNELLQGVVSGGTGTSANFSGMSIAGKTGTTSDNYDRYFVGYTPYYCAAVWCGYDQNEKISYSGNPSITMWKKVMQKIHDSLKDKDFDKPTSGLTTVKVCEDSGLLATSACSSDVRGSRVHTVEVASGTAPTQSCDMHVVRSYCKVGHSLAGSHCPKSDIIYCSFLDYHRTHYSGVSVGDYGSILSNIRSTCPVHSGGGYSSGGGQEQGETTGGITVGGETGETGGETGGGTTGGETGGTTGGTTGGGTTGGTTGGETGGGATGGTTGGETGGTTGGETGGGTTGGGETDADFWDELWGHQTEEGT